MSKNFNYKVAITALLLAILSFLLIFLPSILGIEGFEGGYGISFIAFFLLIAFLVTAVIYWKLGREQEKIINGKETLVHWTYEKKFWDQYTKEEYIRDKSEKKTLFFIVAGWAIFFGILFPIFDHESGIWVSAVMLGLIGLIGIVAFLSIRSSHNRNLKHTGEAYISRRGVYLNGKMISWKLPYSSLVNIKYFNKKKSSFIQFEVSSGSSVHNIRVPIPEGKEKEAGEVVRQLGK